MLKVTAPGRRPGRYWSWQAWRAPTPPPPDPWVTCATCWGQRVLWSRTGRMWTQQHGWQRTYQQERCPACLGIGTVPAAVHFTPPPEG